MQIASRTHQPTFRFSTLNTDLLDYLLSRFSRDLGHLIDLLEQLDNYALQTQRPLTIPLLRAMLDET